jgi:hypothetical protein
MLANPKRFGELRTETADNVVQKLVTKNWGIGAEENRKMKK